MLSLNAIKDIAIKFQTTELNVTREYFQHLFLSYLYQNKNSDGLFFKGGTALRFVYNSPRFSEDLDFSGYSTPYRTKILIDAVTKKIREQIDVELEESKPTSGGYFCKLRTNLYEWIVGIELNISFRKKQLSGESTLITTLLLPSYIINILKEEQLIKEKIDALITRSKPRDYFDLYYIVKSRISIRNIISYKKQLLERIQPLNNKELKEELKEFLPRSYWNILNNLKEVLLKEITRL